MIGQSLWLPSPIRGRRVEPPLRYRRLVFPTPDPGSWFQIIYPVHAITVGVGPAHAVEDADGSPPHRASITLNGTTAGRSLVIGAWWYHATATISSISISGESNATVHGSPTKNAAISNATWQFASLGEITTGGNKTINCDFSASLAGAGGAVALEFAGGNLSSWFDVEAGSTGNNASPQTSVTTTNDNAAIMAGMSTDATEDAPFGAGAGYTLYNLPDVNFWDSSEYDEDVGAAGSKTVPFTAAGSGNWIVKAAAFNNGARFRPMFRGQA